MSTGIILANSYPPRPVLSSDEQLTLNAVLSRLHTRILHYRPLILPFFQDFDLNNSGTVSAGQFTRVLTMMKTDLTKEEFHLLIQAYRHADISFVDYRKFMRDVEQEPQTTEITQKQEESKEQWEQNLIAQNRVFQNSTRNGSNSESTTSSSNEISTVLHKIQTITSQQRKHVNDLFADYDPLRKRVISDSQFIRCLTVASYQLSLAELQCIIQHYGHEVDGKVYVRYQQFVDQINAAFIPVEAELSPLTEMATFIPYDLHQVKPISLLNSSATFSSTSDFDIESLLSEMSYLSSTRCMLLKPSFAAYDRSHTGCITLAAFYSVISSAFPMMKLSPTHLQSLADYFHQGQKGISYQRFCEEIQQREKIYEESLLIETFNTLSIANTDSSSSSSSSVPVFTNYPRQTMNEMFASTLSQPILNLNDLLLSLRQTLCDHRLDLNKTFDDFDRLHTGHVTGTVFYRCLTMSGLRMRQDEIDLLRERYAASKSGKEGQVNYKQFLDDLSNIPKL